MEIRFDASRSVVKREIRSGQGKISGNRDNECDASLFSVYFPFPLCLSLSLSLSLLSQLFSCEKGNSVKRAVENLIIPESAR